MDDMRQTGESARATAIIDYERRPNVFARQIMRRIIRTGVLLLSVGLITSWLPAAWWLWRIGDPIAPLAVVRLTGIGDLPSLEPMMDKLSDSAKRFSGEQRNAIYELLSRCGVTAIGAGEFSNLNPSQFAYAIPIDHYGWDTYKHISWCRLPEGWLEVGKRSALYWPDNKKWYYEYRTGLDETIVDATRVFSIPTSELHYLELPAGISSARYARRGVSNSWTIELRNPALTWAAPTTVRIALWSGHSAAMLLGLLGIVVISPRFSPWPARGVAAMILGWAALLFLTWRWAAPQFASIMAGILPNVMVPSYPRPAVMLLVSAAGVVLALLLATDSFLRSPTITSPPESRG